MSHRIVRTDQAPAAIGPYSQAVSVPAGRLVFLSGQIALHPQSGELVGEGDVEAQTHQVMKNLHAVLAAAQCTFEHVVKCTIYLTDLGDFARVNDVYGSYLGEHRPARATVQVSGLPKGVAVEIDAIAAT